MSNGDAEKKLLELIQSKSPEACLRFFSGMPQEERRKFAKFAQRTLKDTEKKWRDSWGKEPVLEKPLFEQIDNARVCVLATATLGELKKHGWRILPTGVFAFEVVRELKPDWINDWVQFLSESEPRTYHIIRLIYQAGLCDKPTGDGYILGMIEGLAQWRIAPAALWDKDTPLAERIRRSPDIRDEDVWRLFEVEGGGDLSLATFDKYVGGKKTGGWTGTLVELADDGTLSRDRLLDESLHTLERDFAQFRAGWFSRFHEALEPTLDERIARRDRYLGLLASSIPPTVSFALKAISALDKADELSAPELLGAIEPVLQARAKGTVSTGLRLIANAAKRDPSMSASACQLAAGALIHEAADVQKKALDLIDKLGGSGDPDVIAALTDYRDGVAPSLRARFNELIGDTGLLADSNDGDQSLPADEIAKVEPIRSFEEMDRELRRVLEDPSQPLEIERALDGLARFGAAQPEDFEKLTGPLRKRAANIAERYPDDVLQLLLARLAYAFAANEPLIVSFPHQVANVQMGPFFGRRGHEAQSIADVFARRNIEIISLIRHGYQLPLVSAPTDSRGFVAAESLLQRYAEYRTAGIEPGPTDVALALMRLAPDGRHETLDGLAPEDEFERAVAYALGADIPPGKEDWLWVAAAAARLPYDDQATIAKKHGKGLPDAGTRASYFIDFQRTENFAYLTLSVKPTIGRDVPPTYLAPMFHIASASTKTGSVCGYHVNMIRWSSTVWPLNSEPFFSQGVFVFDHGQRLANSPYAGFIEPMLQSHVVVGEMGSALLALGLASTDPAVKGVALEAAISSIEQERVDLDSAQEVFATMIPAGDVPVGRWTKSLTEVSGISAKHARFVRDLIAGSLRHDAANPPRDIGGLVELLYELSMGLDSPLEDVEALNYLQAVTGGGKLKRFAGKLLKQADGTRS